MDTLLERLDSLWRAGPVPLPPPTIRLRSTAEHEPDVRLFFGPDVAPTDRRRAVSWFVRDEGVAGARWEGPALTVRLADDLVEELGRRLEEDHRADLVPATLLAGRTYAVQFLDPNACKGLHLGHLYDSVVGHAIASSLELAGARVRRHCFVCDMGRNVAEAIAGCAALHGAAQPEDHGTKPDHFVGQGYVAYVRDHQHLHARRTGDPIGREDVVVDDAADDVLRRWGRGDPAMLERWRQVRGWVIAGHDETLARLGIAFDRHLWSSDVAGHTDRVIAEGLRVGLFTHGEGGSVVHHSGREDYGTIVLRRSDGFPTEHGRQLGLMEALQDEVADLDGYITVEGEEWKPSCAVLRDIRLALGPCRYHDKARRLHHGMVQHGTGTMTSSGGDVLHVDDLLDRMAGAERTAELVELSDGDCEPGAIARIVTVVPFLARSRTRPMTISWDQMLSTHHNPGWAAAEAWCRTTAARAVEGAPVDPSDPVTRLAVLEAQGIRSALADGARDLDLLPATATLRRLAGIVGRGSGTADRLLHGPVRSCLEACGAI